MKTPAPVMDAPAGAPAPSEKVKAFAGMSGSVAIAVKVSNVSSSTVLLPMAARIGGRLTSRTVIDTVPLFESGGTPLSVQVKVAVKLPGP